MWSLWRDICNQAHILVDSYCYLQGTDIFNKGFSALLIIEKCKKLSSQNFFLEKICNYIKANSNSFPRAQSPTSWSSPWTESRLYCRSATSVVNDLTLIELNGEKESLFYNPFLLSITFDKIWGGTL